MGRSDILDKRVKLSGTAYMVVGIMPPGFSFPSETDLWIPLTIPASFESLAPFKDTRRQGRLRAPRQGVSVELFRPHAPEVDAGNR